MVNKVDFGFRPLTAPKDGQVARFLAGGTLWRHSIVVMDTDGDVIVKADTATGVQHVGVALNYAESTEEVIVCIDPGMKYVTTYTVAPNALKADIGQYFITSENDAAKDATMNAKISGGKILTGADTFIPGAHCARLLGVYEDKTNLAVVGDYSGASPLDILVVVHVMSDFAVTG